MNKKIARAWRVGRVSTALAAALCAPNWSWAQPPEKSFADMVSKLVLVPPGEQESEVLTKASVAVGHLKRMDLPQASTAINEALQLDTRNTYLHFLNGFIYHLQARQGDSQKYEMAIEGYQQALRIDPSNWIAQEFLGLTYLDLKQYEPAKAQFTDVLLMSPDSTVSLYGLMASAYMTGDPTTACAMADQYKKVSPTPQAGFIKSSIAVYASCGEFDKADAMRASYGQLQRESLDLESVDRRLNQWKSNFRERASAGFVQTSLNAPTSAGLPPEPIVIAQAFMGSPRDQAQAPVRDDPPADTSPQPSPTPPMDGQVDPSSRMVMVDVVLVSTQEMVTTAKGINLLNALTLQLGSASQAAFSQTFSSSTQDLTPTRVITRALTIPALSYSLNIANANNTLNEVLARPTLAALEGQPSEFFSGTNLNAAVVSTSALGTASAVPVDKRFGVKLAVTPSFMPNGMVKLKVEAQRTFLNANVDSAGFAYRLEISETSANANVIMKMGETLVLSGLSEKESSSSRTGVPGLQDVPGVQYFFSTKRNSDFQRSVLILITPRSPIYTNKAGPGGVVSDSMKALREKFGFSARTPSNVESILNHLKTTNLFRDFRQGDVSLERWDRMHTTGDRLRQALGFLYY